MLPMLAGIPGAGIWHLGTDRDSSTVAFQDCIRSCVTPGLLGGSAPGSMVDTIYTLTRHTNTAHDTVRATAAAMTRSFVLRRSVAVA